ncbi:MAG: sulfotransferase [Planctomycetaceae bacterium]
MIPWVAAGLLVICLMALLQRFELVAKSRDVVAVSRQSLAVIRDAALTDDAKQSALQHNARRLFGLSFLITVGGAAAVAFPAGLLWLCDRGGFVGWDETIAASLHPVFIIATIAVMILLYWSGRRSDSGFSIVDRLLHRLVFKTYAAQAQFADMEDVIYAGLLERRSIDRPVFITALPRAGTTLLLETWAKLPEFAAHTYRDMPFVLTPMLWNRFAGLFHRAEITRERAHGDGMLIRGDSPEALEEVAWKTYWRPHYQFDRIVPWRRDERDVNDEFPDFFRNHMRKIILLRRGSADGTRYLSKNNLNIARIGLLKRLFPQSIIVVPFRQPLQHAASLLRQHLNFTRIHREDRFAAEYMRAIGHFEFGENLQPIDFDDWLNQRREKEFTSLKVWLEYWLATYRHLLTADRERVHFIDFDALCNNPEKGLQSLAGILQCRDPSALLAAATAICPARPHDVGPSDIPAPLMNDVDAVYSRLKAETLRYGGPPRRG